MIPTEDDLVKKWNDICVKYSDSYSLVYMPMGLSMYSIICGEDSDSILEVGCGNGSLAVEILMKKKRSAKFVGVDISHSMCVLTREKMKLLEQLVKSGGILDYHEKVHKVNSMPDCSEWRTEDDPSAFPFFNSYIYRGSAENLGFLEDSSFQSILSCQTLHIVSNPLKMLKECFRILKPGGLAIFSVWGDKTTSYEHSLFDEALEYFKLPPSNSREPWHLSKKDTLESLADEAGFEDIQIWDQMIPRKLVSNEERRKIIEFLQELRWPDKNTKDQATEYLLKREDEILSEKKFPIGLNCKILCVKRPLK